MQNANLDFNLHEKQGLCFQSRAQEILYGGAAGGGKSHLLRIVAIVLASQIPGLQVYLFRRKSKDLEKNHLEGAKGLRAMLAPWVASGFVEIVKGEIRFGNGANRKRPFDEGSRIYLCHCQHEDDKYNYQGAEIHVLLIDELTHFTKTQYEFLRSRVRCVGLKIPDQWKHMVSKIITGSNPIGIGVGWVKAAFVDPKPALEVWKADEDEGGMLRQYIPARLSDNPSMTEDDPSYEQRLQGLGSPELVKAMLDGDWSVVIGAFFKEMTPKHILKPFEIPDYWTRFRSFDWGGFRPFSVGWYAVSDGTVTALNAHGEEVLIPANALIKYREWYGASEPNVGLQMRNIDIARGILARESSGERINYSVADPAIFINQGGESIGETFAKEGVVFRRADNKRIGGWSQLRDRLIGEEARPMIYFFETCRNIIRTLPLAPHDEGNPEDIDTEFEDHALDETRYACMSRPYSRPRPKEHKKLTSLEDVTLNFLWENSTIPANQNNRI